MLRDRGSPPEFMQNSWRPSHCEWQSAPLLFDEADA